MTTPEQKREYKRDWMRVARQKAYIEHEREYVKKVMRDYKNGLRVDAIAEKHNLTIRRVHALLRLSTHLGL